MNAQKIQDLILAGMPGAQAQVTGEDGVHFEAVVISEAFQGKLPLPDTAWSMPRWEH